MSVPSLSSVQLFSAMKNSRAYGIDKGKGGKSFIYCRVKTQLSTYSSLREPRSSPFVYAKINSLIYGQRTKQGSARDTNHTRCCLSHMEMEPCYHKDKRKCLFEWSQKIWRSFLFSPKNGLNVTCGHFLFLSFHQDFAVIFSFLVPSHWMGWLISGTSLKGVNEIWSFKEEKQPWKSSRRVAHANSYSFSVLYFTPKYF